MFVYIYKLLGYIKIINIGYIWGVKNEEKKKDLLSNLYPYVTEFIFNHLCDDDDHKKY